MRTQNPVEVELKLLLPPHAGMALECHPVVQAAGAGATEVRHERTVYFDTPAFDLAKHGLSLRVRIWGDRSHD